MNSFFFLWGLTRTEILSYSRLCSELIIHSSVLRGHSSGGLSDHMKPELTAWKLDAFPLCYLLCLRFSRYFGVFEGVLHLEFLKAYSGSEITHGMTRAYLRLWGWNQVSKAGILTYCGIYLAPKVLWIKKKCLHVNICRVGRGGNEQAREYEQVKNEWKKRKTNQKKNYQRKLGWWFKGVERSPGLKSGTPEYAGSSIATPEYSWALLVATKRQKVCQGDYNISKISFVYVEAVKFVLFSHSYCGYALEPIFTKQLGQMTYLSHGCLLCQIFYPPSNQNLSGTWIFQVWNRAHWNRGVVKILIGNFFFAAI